MTIGDRIRRIRKKRRLTQAELAMMSGLSLSAIQGYEQGRYEPKRKSLESIAEVFKIPVDELYDMPALGTNLASLGTDCISRQAAIDRATKEHDFFRGAVTVSDKARRDELLNVMCWLGELPPAEPKRETATVSVGKSKGGVTMWYECAACGEPVDQGDTFCSGCGRRLIYE